MQNLTHQRSEARRRNKTSKMLSAADIATSQEEYQRFCEGLHEDASCDIPLRPPHSHVNLLDGGEDIGMEIYSNMTHDELMAALSLGGAKSLPFGNVAGPESKPISPFWHQVAGICAILANAFTRRQGVSGNPTMLCDEVGLGKTIQILGVIQMIAHMHHQQESTQSKKLTPLPLAIGELVLIERKINGFNDCREQNTIF